MELVNEILADQYGIEQEIRKVEAEQSAGLAIPKEAIQGGLRQTEEVGLLQSRLSASLLKPSSANECVFHDLGERLRDVYSLQPSNRGIEDMIKKIFRALNPSVSAELSGLEGWPLIAHTSCHRRLGKARQSVESFGDSSGRETHLIVVGAESQPACDLVCELHDGLLEIPVNDSYEHLVSKILYLCFLLWAADAVPPVLAKLDDDARLTSRASFSKLISMITQGQNQYFGIPVGSQSHSEMMHGWHIGKCTDKTFEQRGMQVPLPQRYAAGPSYFLGPQAVLHLKYIYLSHNAYHSACTLIAEDAAVGLHLHLAGIPLNSFSGEHKQQDAMSLYMKSLSTEWLRDGEEGWKAYLEFRQRVNEACKARGIDA